MESLFLKTTKLKLGANKETESAPNLPNKEQLRSRKVTSRENIYHPTLKGEQIPIPFRLSTEQKRNCFQTPRMRPTLYQSLIKTTKRTPGQHPSK